MTKRSTTKTSRPQADRASLAEVDKRLTKLGQELVKQLNEYAQLYAKRTEARRSAGQPACDIDQDLEVIGQLAAHSKGPLDVNTIRAVVGELVSGSRSLVAPVKVAYLGPPYSYSHLAATQRFGSSAELVPVATIAAVFEEVNRRQADYGLVPIENSTDGRVVDTLDMLARLPVRICGEVQLRIHHQLLAKCPRVEIREVYSKPQALSQCREWLHRHLPDARTVEMTSTAAAAQLAADKPGAAAVASRQAAVRYGLDIVAADIEDNKNNVTRFAVISNQSAARSGHDRTSILFQIPHQPGSLADATAIFKRGRLNMTWIESFPIPGARNEYLFFVELEGHQDEAKVKRALESLQKMTVRLEVLGSYATTEPVD